MKITSQISTALLCFVLFSCATSQEVLRRSKIQRTDKSQIAVNNDNLNELTAQTQTATQLEKTRAEDIQMASDTPSALVQAVQPVNLKSKTLVQQTQPQSKPLHYQIAPSSTKSSKNFQARHELKASGGFFGSVGHAFAVVGLVFLVIGLIFYLMGGIIGIPLGAFFIGFGLIFLLIWLVLFIVQSLFDVIL